MRLKREAPMTIEFENPAALFLFLAIPVVYVLRCMKILSRISLPLNLSDWNGGNFKWNGTARTVLYALEKILCACFFVCLVLAYANPVRHKPQKLYASKGASLVFVIDASPSMAAKDIGAVCRLEAAKNAIAALAEANEGAELGLVEMAENAVLLVPPTMDRTLFFSRLNSITVGELGDGTAIGTGLACAVYHLEKTSAPRKSIVLMTDGENNSGTVHPHTAARLALSKNISLYILGIGTKGSIPLEYADPKTHRVYSGYLESNFDAESISKIAAEANGSFFEIESLPSLFQAISSVSKSESVVQSYYMKNQDTFYYAYFLSAAVLFAVLAWIIRRAVLREVL